MENGKHHSFPVLRRRRPIPVTANPLLEVSSSTVEPTPEAINDADVVIGATGASGKK